MLKVALVNMPFADWNRPSFGLSQLSSVLRTEFAEDVSVQVVYLNQDVADYFGTETYESIALHHDHVDTGIGDWLFRSVAFPDAPDNTEEYFQRFYRGERWADFRSFILERRSGLTDLCNKLIDRHELGEADVVGFSSMFAQHVPSLAGARLVKQRNPAVHTLLGGANCEAPMGAVIAEQVPYVDFVFSGPALESLPQLIRHVLDDDLPAADAVPGILTERNATEPRFRRAVGRDRAIDQYVLPDYDTFFAALHEHPVLRQEGQAEPTLFFETSRGCWWGQRSHCTFCGLNGQGMDYRSLAADRAVEQFEWLFRYSDEFPALFCTDNVMPRHYPRDVFDKLKTPPGVSIYYEVKLPLSRKDIKKMVRAGVNMVQPGIEALATSSLKLMGKGTTAFQNLQFLKHCVEFGIHPDWNLLIGFPNEDPAVYDRYLEFLPHLVHLPPPHGVYMVRFDRFSPYFNKKDEYALDLHPMDHYPLIYPFSPESLDELAYFFADHSLAPYMINAISKNDALSELVRGWRKAWFESGGPHGELTLAGSTAEGWEIRDSRSGSPAVHCVDAETAGLLSRLSSPARMDQLSAEWGTGAARLTELMDWLGRHDLLFEEDGRYLSLVLTPQEEADAEGESDGPRRVPLPLIAP
ncbi:RiPP maturation radical SAM C-methyltransferase [Streptomyces goshikiensis]|uniref:RiPP maturation radical SAM C-methyltransferase n=1 Tax=Streptomyces goshikiensis TaxID=1942 RepID=UPI0036CF3F5C